MDSSQNREIFGYSNTTPSRPEYPTPPSSFFERRDQVDDHFYYGSTTLSPSLIHSDFRIGSELGHYNVSTFQSALYKLLNFL